MSAFGLVQQFSEAFLRSKNPLGKFSGCEIQFFAEVQFSFLSNVKSDENFAVTVIANLFERLPDKP